MNKGNVMEEEKTGKNIHLIRKSSDYSKVEVDGEPEQGGFHKLFFLMIIGQRKKKRLGKKASAINLKTRTGATGRGR